MVYLELLFLFIYNPEHLTLLGLSFALKCQNLCHICIVFVLVGDSISKSQIQTKTDMSKSRNY